MKRITFLILLTLGILLSAVNHWNYRNDIKEARANYREGEHGHAAIIAQSIEHKMREVYQGLRTIARLPGIQAIDQHSEGLEFRGGGSGIDDTTRRTIQEIYNNLAGNVAMSEVYIVPVDMDSDGHDPFTDIPQAPMVTFDDLIVNQNGEKSDHGESDVEEIEIYEYRMMQEQLAWMRRHTPTVESVEGMDYPAIGSHEVLTCDNSRYSPSQPDDLDRSGIVYSLPFFGTDGVLKGCVTGVMLTEAIRDLIPNDHYILMNSAHRYAVGAGGEKLGSLSEVLEQRGSKESDSVYSEIFPLQIQDVGGEWVLWANPPDDQFWSRSDVVSAEHMAWAGQFGAWILVIGSGIVFHLVQRNRSLLVVRSQDLEERVEQRTRALTIEQHELKTQKAAIDEAAIVSMTDIRGDIIYANDKFCEISGYSREELMGQNHRKVKSDEHAKEFFREMWLEVSQGRVWHGEVKNLKKDGSYYWVDATIVPFKDTNEIIDRYVAIRYDITERKDVEERVEQRTRELKIQQEELKRSNKLLKKAQTRAVASMQAKSDFLANMSHEIRTPLNGILGFTDLLLRGADEEDEDERQEWLTIMQASGRHLLALINDILDLSKIEAGHLEVECIPTSPHGVIAEAASMMRPRASEKNLSLEVQFEGPFPVSIETDPTRLRQLLVNLVGNAIKFTDEGSVRIVARLRADSPGIIEVDIIDTGMGISADKLGVIFDPFIQADSTVTRHFGGTGLGLAISYRIVEALGGDLTVRSEVGKGSTFTVSLETGSLENVRMIEQEDAEAILTSHTTQKGQDGDSPTRLEGKVLLVEDGVVNRKLIRLLLQRAGLTVSMAEHGQAGVELARRESFDLILMDMQMPVIDGYLATSTLRSEGCTLPIIALTAHAMRGDEDRCMAAGCTGYLTKPVDRDELLRTVARGLGQGRSGSWTASSPEPKNEVNEVNEAKEPALVSSLGMEDPEFRDIVSEFTDRLSDRLELMQKAYEERDVATLERLAHWLKGSGGTVGLDAFTEPASRLEFLLEERNFEEIESAIAELTRMAGRIVVDQSEVAREL